MAGTTLFADRGFLTANGFELAHVKSVEVDIDESLARVETCTRDRSSAGFKYGNRKITWSAELEVEADRAQVDLALATKGADIRLVFELGGERHVLQNCAQGSQSMRGSVGDGSKSIKGEALQITNENGTAVNTGISLG